MKIHYDHMRNAADVFEKQLFKCSDTYSQYLEALDVIEKEGFKSGEAASGLRVIASMLNSVRDVPIELYGKLEEVNESLLNEVHKAQVVDGESILYSLEYPDLRDYSSKFFMRLRNDVESADYDEGFWNKCVDAIEDTVIAFACKIFGYCDTSSKDKLIDSQANMLQFKDVTAKRLIDIKNNIWDIDSRRGAEFTKIAEALELFSDYVYQIGNVFMEISNTQIISISTEEINQLNKIYSEMMEKLNTAISINVITDEEVLECIETGTYNKFDDESVEIINEYLLDLSSMDLGDWEFWKMAILQMFNIAETELSSEFEADKIFIKNEMLDIMKEASDSFSYSDTDVHEYTDELSEILGYVKKYGDKWKDFYPYDKRTKEYKKLDGFLSEVGDIKDFLKYGDKAIEILAPMFTDYEKNLEFLDSMERYFEADGAMKDAFTEIRAQYEKDLSSRYEEIKTFVAEEAIDAAYKLSVGKEVELVKKSIELVGSATGDLQRTGAQYELLVYGYDMADMSTTALQESLTKLSTLSESSEEYATVMADVKNNFNLYKTTTMHLFEKMATASSGDDTSYYYYCSQQVSKMKITDLNNMHIMSKEEYLSQTNEW